MKKYASMLFGLWAIAAFVLVGSYQTGRSLLDVLFNTDQRCGVGFADHGDSYVVEGGTVQIRGEANGKVLYEYTARGNRMGTPCP